jgi:cadmium resistance protein CadD (predicted permease)
MESSLALVGLALALFAFTNVDDIFVLVGFFSDPRVHVREIVIGQYVGIAALFGISVAVSMISFVIPNAYLGLLGMGYGNDSVQNGPFGLMRMRQRV